MSFARIETERLILRPFANSDVDALHALWMLPDVRRYLWDDEVIDRDTAESLVTASGASFCEKGYGLCCVSARDDGARIGFCGLRDYDEGDGVQRPELLYGLDPAHWRHGYALEASVAVLRFGFEECGLDPIYGGIDPPNGRSRRVLERIGMRGWRRLEIGGLPADYSELTRLTFESGGHRGARYLVVA